ncbi:MAG: MBL fold metallo-hydrolase [Synergistaceae bacterium]|jgi:glyoxylase-like metal-dependent hydrolase (beta-lactamase superfamily II)|nr:MBL fold metallo-hydrolase [Synergistaceae bacterium]
MEKANITGYGNGIFCVDSGYEGGGVAAVYIIRDGQSAAIVDTAHNGALEPVASAMSELGIPDGMVEHIFLTHVHLDHSGGAGRFAGKFPNARVVVHERGARHVADPSKLVAGATEVYGKEAMDRLYGEILPVSADRIYSPKNGEEIRVGNRVFVCLDTPGHALHHLAFHDTSSRSVFSGDAYGMSYREPAVPDGRFAIVTTSPVQFDPAAMSASMRLIDSLEPDCLYPTHFGRMPIGGALSDSLYRQIDMSVKIAEEAEGDKDRIKDGLVKLFMEETSRQGCPAVTSDYGRITGEALEINSQGLAVWYKKSRNKG